ncbi:hypothetical protein KP509_35G032100 [Ceratopteris richardii]|uniref:Thioredoxin domain-containing protein n=1 Tax=Ceratopteris richardii TaxID=49495 RepID=A0A8T2QEB6_CERRI|nr:hypothetical protein KP509_35G032100 [Ceratopteris richardii]
MAAALLSYTSSSVGTTAYGASSMPTRRKSEFRTSLRGTCLKIAGPLKSSTGRARREIVMRSKHYLVDKISGAELNKLLENEREQPMVVDFYAAWCGPCVLLAQEIEMLAVEFQHEVKFVKIDTDDEYELAHRLQIRGLPTVLFISKDPQKVALRAEGILPHEVYRKIIMEDLLCGESKPWEPPTETV